MFRFYKDFVDKLLVTLLYMRHGDGTRLDNVHNWVGGYRGLQEDVKPYAINAVRTYNGGSFDEMIEVVKLQQHEYTKKTHGIEGDLIDKLVVALQLPYARNVLSTRSLTMLRNALLLPSEMGGLINRLETREIQCAGCDRVFTDGEQVTIVNDGTVSFLCNRCRRPSVVCCDHCDVGVPIDSKIRKLQKNNVTCGAHGDKKVEEEKTTLYGGQVEPLMTVQAPETATFRDGVMWTNVQATAPGTAMGAGQANAPTFTTRTIRNPARPRTLNDAMRVMMGQAEAENQRAVWAEDHDRRPEPNMPEGDREE